MIKIYLFQPLIRNSPYKNNYFFLFQSEESLSSEGSATSHVSSASTEDSGSEVACNITLIERLIRSHPIWFLPGIQRAGAFHLLQGKEEGVSVYFIKKKKNFVRKRLCPSSETLALFHGNKHFLRLYSPVTISIERRK